MPIIDIEIHFCLNSADVKSMAEIRMGIMTQCVVRKTVEGFTNDSLINMANCEFNEWPVIKFCFLASVMVYICFSASLNAFSKMRLWRWVSTSLIRVSWNEGNRR
jgi:hypothetical protein